MDFVNRLRPIHLQSFWFFASKVNFTLIGTFGSLLWATAPTQEEADFYRTRLHEYRWTLSVSSKRADFLGYAVQMLDASRGLLKNLGEKPSLPQRQTNEAGVPEYRELEQSVGEAMEVEEEDAPQLFTDLPGPSFMGFPDDHL